MKKEKKKIDLKKYLKIPGKVRGVVFQTDAYYIESRFGKQAVKKIEEEAKRSGFPIPYRKTAALEWYPAGLRAISLYFMRTVLGFDDNEIRNMGYTAPKVSLIIKLLMKFFVSPKKVVEKVPHYWREHYSAGELYVRKYQPEKKLLIVVLKEMKICPDFCIYLEGYFMKIWEFIIGKASCVETKCMYRGDRAHEYTVKW